MLQWRRACSLLPQTGHILQSVGSVNNSMGGAATAQPINISGALYWNPATISAFDEKIISVDASLFFSSPELSSSVTMPGASMAGTTKDDRAPSVLPSLAAVFGKAGSKHTFGVSLFGVSGFGVDFPQSTTNPINLPQNQGGFGHLVSDYAMMQAGVSYAYQLSEKFFYWH